MSGVEETPEKPAEPTEVEKRFPVPARIRNRRLAIGLTGSDLAARIGVSPSYISLIENGVKIPSSRVALDIARALDDDPDLYLAWVHSVRQGGWKKALRSSDYIRAYSSNPKARNRVASGEDLDAMELGTDQRRNLANDLAEETIGDLGFDEPAATLSRKHEPAAAAPGLVRRTLRGLLGEAKRAQESPRAFTLLEIPILDEGADPGRGDDVDEAGTVDTLFLDSRLFPESSLRRPFAYRPSEAATAASAASVPMSTPIPSRKAFSARTIQASRERRKPKARSVASSPRRSMTLRTSTTPRPTVPRSNPNPPSTWNVERYVFCTAS